MNDFINFSISLVHIIIFIVLLIPIPNVIAFTKTDITLNGTPSSIVVDPFIKKAFVAYIEGKIDVVDILLEKITKTIPVGDAITNIVTNTKDHMLYISNKTATIAILNTLTNELNKDLQLNPIRAFDPTINQIYMLTPNLLQIADANTFNIISNTSKIASSTQIAINSLTHIVYIINTKDKIIYMIDGRSANLLNTFSIPGSEVNGVGIDNKNNKIFVTSYGPSRHVNNVDINDGIPLTKGSLYTLNEKINKILGNITLPGSPTSLDIDNEKNKVYIALFNIASVSSQGITIINSLTGHMENHIETGLFPSALTVDSVTHKIFVINKFSRTLSIISPF